MNISGQEQGRINAQVFAEWLCAQTDEQLILYRANNNTTILNRTQLAKVVGLKDRKRITENKACREYLEAREADLRNKGYLDKKSQQQEHEGVPFYVSNSKDLKAAKRVAELEKRVVELQTQVELIKTQKESEEEKNARFSEFNETLDEIKGGLWG